MNKVIDFKELEKDIQKYADDNFEGNFTMAVRRLVKDALSSKE